MHGGITMSGWKQFGSFLVEEGFVSENMVDRALEHQERLKKMPLGEILVQLNMLTRDALDSLVQAYMAERRQEAGPPARRIGEFLVERGAITPLQLAAAVRQQRKYRSQRLGELLVEMGKLQPKELDHAIIRQMSQIALSGWK